MSIVAAVKRAIESGCDHHWRIELPEPEQIASFQSVSLDGWDAWIDSYRMYCAEKYVGNRRLYQNMPVFDI